MLIVDLHLRLEGHYLGFIESIVTYVAAYKPARSVIILLPYSAKSIDIQLSDDVSFVFAPETQHISEQLNIREKAALEWQIIEKYAREYGTEQVVLMEWDLYQFEIGKATIPFKVSGIWFRPYSRIESLQIGLFNKIKTHIWRFQKQMLCWWSLRNKNINKIFLLNDKKTVEEMNTRFRQVFKYLPDPILTNSPKPNFDIRHYFEIASNRVVFLIFGVIEARKNVVNILKAIEQLSEQDAAKTTLLIVGRVWDNYLEELDDALKKVLEKQPKVQIVSVRRFVDNDELENFFSQADVVLVTYQNFFGSSGIVGNAAKYNKPLIASNYGLIGEQVEQNGLGVCVNPNDVADIKKAIQLYLENKNSDSKNGLYFANQHKKERFVEILLGVEHS